MSPEGSEGPAASAVSMDAPRGGTPSGSSKARVKKEGKTAFSKGNSPPEAASDTADEPPLPGPSPSAWRTAASDDDSDTGTPPPAWRWESSASPSPSSWGTGSGRHLSQKQLHTAGTRNARRRGVRRREKRASIIDAPASDGEEGEKPSRPSDIVGYHSDSCVDDDFDAEDVEAHRRLVRATIMKVRAMDRQGKPIPARRSTLEIHGMEGYGLYYQPAAEDLAVRRERKGFDRLWGKRAVKDFRCTQRRKQRVDPLLREASESSDGGESAPVAGPIGGLDYYESSDVEMAEVDEEPPKQSGITVDENGVVEIADDYGEERQVKSIKAEAIAVNDREKSPKPTESLESGEIMEITKPVQSGNSGDHGAPSDGHPQSARRTTTRLNGENEREQPGIASHDPAPPRNDSWERCVARLGYKLAEDNGKSSVRRGILSLGKRLRVVDTAAPRKKKKKNPEVVLMKELEDLVEDDPELLFSGCLQSSGGGSSSSRKKNDEATTESKQKQKLESDLEAVEDKPSDSDASSYEDEEMNTVSMFDKMKIDALGSFYNTRKAVDVSSAEEEEESEESAEEDQKEKLLGQDESEVENNPGFTIMSKFGFKGRLGANEDGIATAVEHVKRDGRGGIGTRAGFFGGVCRPDSSDDGSSLSKCKRKKTSGMMQSENKRKKKGEKHVEMKKKKKKNAAQTKKEEKKEPSLLSTASGEFDNNRRAILLDFDALTLNSHARRVLAFNSVIQKFGEKYRACGNVAAHLTDIKHGNLSDYHVAEKVQAECNLPTNVKAVTGFLRHLDAAFLAAPPLLLDHGLIAKLKRASHNFRIGVLHYGAGKRVPKEVALAGLPEHFHTITVHHLDKAPYTRSWREAYCRAGVHPRQSMMLLSDHGRSRALSGVITARELNAKSFVRVQANAGRGTPDVSAMTLGAKNMFGASLAGSEEQVTRVLSFEKFLLKLAPIRRTRVWALNGQDRLWHAAEEVWRLQKGDEEEDGPMEVQVRFLGEEKNKRSVTVLAKNVRTLEDKDFEVLEKNEFPGMMDPSVDGLVPVLCKVGGGRAGNRS